MNGSTIVRGVPGVAAGALQGEDSTIPWDIRDAVIMWGRERGTGAKIVWNTRMNCAEVQLDLKPGDPRLAAKWHPGVESIYLHRQESKVDPVTGDVRPIGHYKAVRLGDLGVSGVLNWLNEGNLLSGTGRYRTLDGACKAADRHNEQVHARMERQIVENGRLRARDQEKFNVPREAVLSNLTDNLTAANPE